jgi:hypothetical protein
MNGRERQLYHKPSVLKATDVMRATVEQVTLGSLPTRDAANRLGSRDLTRVQPETAASKHEREHREAMNNLRETLTLEFDAALVNEKERCKSSEAAIAEQHQAQIQRIRNDQIDFVTCVSNAMLEFYEAAQSALVEIACSIARAVLERPPTEDDYAIIAKSMAWSMERLAGDGHMDVHLSTELASRLEQFNLLPQLEIPSLVRWHRSDELASGDFVVVSPTATIRRVRDEAVARATSLVVGTPQVTDGVNNDGGPIAASDE